MTDFNEDEYWNNLHDQNGTCSECGQPLCGCCGVCHQCQNDIEKTTDVIEKGNNPLTETFAPLRFVDVQYDFLPPKPSATDFFD